MEKNGWHVILLLIWFGISFIKKVLLPHRSILEKNEENKINLISSLKKLIFLWDINRI
jgi:hypothetical protein